MSSDVRQLYERASTGIRGSDYDGNYLKSLSMIVPKNSGIQTVNMNVHLTQHIAQYLHWKFVPHAVAFGKATEYGMVSITSENGGGLKMLNTSRNEQLMTMKNSTNQKPDAWDKYVYGKEKFDNNEG